MNKENLAYIKVYPNLEAEMTRSGISRQDLSETLQVRYATIITKLKGDTLFKYDEALKIKNTHFPDLMLEYLFAKSE